jgi:hypothetical protein
VGVRDLTATRRAAVIAGTFCLLAALPARPAGAEPTIHFLPSTAGQTVVYRVERTNPGANGAQSVSALVALQRQDDASFTLQLGDPPLDAAVVRLAGDGSLVLGATGSTTADGNLRDVVYALNLALAVTQNVDQAVHGVWSANVPLARVPVPSTATVALFPADVAGSDFDFSGSGEAISAPPAEPSTPPRRGSRGNADAPTGSDAGQLMNVSVQGRVVGGRVMRVAIAQSQSSIATANAPALTIGSWSVTVVK